MNNVAVCIGAELAAYGFGQGHPFGPDRMDAFWHAAMQRGLDQRVVVMTPEQAEVSDILRFHTQAYVDRVRARSADGQGFLDYGDTPAFPGVYEAASTVVGSVLKMAGQIIAGQCCYGFVPIAGLHHARRNVAAGFCVFNDAGVLIHVLREMHGVQRIAYVDIDAHHGDGVFYAFESDPDLCIADIHEDGRHLYPGTGYAQETGSGEAKGSKLNLPMRPGADDQDFFAAWSEAEAHVRAFDPEFIILQCGADSIEGDPITHMRFSPKSHAYATASLCAIADHYCGGRLLALGGGGYNRQNLVLAWCSVVEAMLSTD